MATDALWRAAAHLLTRDEARRIAAKLTPSSLCSGPFPSHQREIYYGQGRK
jgi:hypothetical protein